MSVEKVDDRTQCSEGDGEEQCCKSDETESFNPSTITDTENVQQQEFIDIHAPSDNIGVSVEECGEDLRLGGSTIAEVTDKLSQQCLDSDDEYHSAEEESEGEDLDIQGDKFYACESDGVSGNNCVGHHESEVRTEDAFQRNVQADSQDENSLGSGDHGAQMKNAQEEVSGGDIDLEDEKEKEEEIAEDEEYRKKVEESLSDDEKLERKNEAQTIKDKGNQCFREGSYKEAIKLYNEALQICPLSFPKERSIMFSNRAACQMKLDDTDDAIKSCSKALELHPHYMKALLRRAELYEKADKLDEALADYQKAVELDPSQHAARHKTLRLADQVKERNEKLKTEMLGKLKDLGNMILKPFGMSTDNFQLQQDPQTGSYSVNFQQNQEKK